MAFFRQSVDFFEYCLHSGCMSNALQPKPRVFGQRVRICVIASKYNEKFTDPLVENTIEELDEIVPMARIDLIRVTGAFEIPVTVANLLQREKFNCVIALGVIIRGETQHADLVASSVTESLQSLAVEHRIPIIHEVLLVNNEKQAQSRCMGDTKNRGREAARAAANIIDVFAEIEKSMPLDAKRKAK
jgi:6,7-dimethyl-8-ribityllumazine synthase